MAFIFFFFNNVIKYCCMFHLVILISFDFHHCIYEAVLNEAYDNQGKSVVLWQEGISCKNTASFMLLPFLVNRSQEATTS